MANRIWHYHFGRGIVETPNDFGFSGVRPSHPELLDWLAAELVSGDPQSPWSVKRLHKLILMSATYRQASTVNAAAVAVDSDDAMLWRFAPRRLEGEIVRDAMLAVSGKLNPQLGGPSFRPFIVTNHVLISTNSSTKTRPISTAARSTARTSTAAKVRCSMHWIAPIPLSKSLLAGSPPRLWRRSRS